MLLSFLKQDYFQQFHYIQALIFFETVKVSVILSQQQIGKFFVIEIDALFEGSFLTTLVISSINNGLKEKFLSL